MSRRYYQKEEDLQREREVITRVCEHFDRQAVKMPDYSRTDYLLHDRGVATSVVEVKCRNVSSAKYETYMISKGKYDALLGWIDMGFRAVIAVRWTDCIGVVKLPVEHDVDTGGRTDRGDAMDIERIVLIPIDKFHMLPNK